MSGRQTLIFSRSGTWPSPLTGNFCRDNPDISYFQSEHYYRVLKALGQKPFLITAAWEDCLAGYWLLYESPQNFHLQGKHTRKPFSWLLRGLTALYGPVIITDNSSTYMEYFTSFVKELQKTIIEGHYLFNTFVAPLYDHMYGAEALDGILADQDFCVEDTFTFLLSLEGTMDEIRACLPKETRNKLNRAARQEIETGEGSSEDDLGEYYGARCENMKRNGVECTPYDYYLTQWRILHDSSVMKLFLARSEGKVLAGQLAFLFGEVVHLAGVTVSDYCIQHKLAGNDALQWAMIEWAHRNGYKIIDYTGAHPHTTDEKLKAIHAFKARWGGTLTRYQTFRYSSPSWRKQLVQLYRFIRGT